MHVVAQPRDLQPPRDPAWHGRITAVVIFLAVLLPAGYLAEFNPAVLWNETSLRSLGRFLGSFFPPVTSAEFLRLVAEAAWKTVAIATVGTAFAMAIALPLALGATRVLSISRIATGRMALLPAIIRTGIRWLLIFLRSIPEIVWAMIFVRAVGLGDTAGVVAIGITYGGMLGKVYIEIFESAENQAVSTLLQNGVGRLQAFWYAVRHAKPLTVGLNCSFGAAQLRPHVRTLSALADTLVMVYPNAGLPNELGEYDERPEETAGMLGEWTEGGWVNVLGGCCGSTPGHIAAIAAAVKDAAPRAIPALAPDLRLAGLEPFTIAA